MEPGAALKALVITVLTAPFVAAVFRGVNRMENTIYSASRVEGEGQLAEAQASAHEGAQLSLDFLEVASGLEPYILLGILLVGLVGLARAAGPGF